MLNYTAPTGTRGDDDRGGENTFIKLSPKAFAMSPNIQNFDRTQIGGKHHAKAPDIPDRDRVLHEGSKPDQIGNPGRCSWMGKIKQ